jgi:hypothetical protein
MQFWIYFISIFAIVSFRIASRNVLTMDGLGHHILLTSTLGIAFYGGIWQTTCTETILKQFKRWKKKLKLLLTDLLLTLREKKFPTSNFDFNWCWLPPIRILNCFPLTDYFARSTVLINTKIIPVHQVLKKQTRFKLGRLIWLTLY